MNQTTRKLRPSRPWWAENDVRDNNPFIDFTSPAAIFAYIYAELPPEVTTDLLDSVLDAGAGKDHLLQDATALAEMGHGPLAELVMQAYDRAPDQPMSISDTDFRPELLTNAGEVILKTTAAVTRMYVRARCEGVSIYERED